LPVPRGFALSVAIDGVERLMCCAGCCAVAQTIVDHGLTAYYRQRSALPLREDTVPAAVRELAAYEIAEVEIEVAREDGEHAREATLMLEGHHLRCLRVADRAARKPPARSAGG
jgi:Cu2+-exporting ATPase